MAQTTVNVRVDENLKSSAESLFNELGMNLSTAMNLFLRSALRYGGIPFDLRLEQDARPTAQMKADILQKVAQSEAAVAAGQTMDADDSLRQLRAKYGV